MNHIIARVTNERTTLAFARVSLRARAAIERAGGFVAFDRRSRKWLATMPEPSDWFPGDVLPKRDGRPHVARAATVRTGFVTVYTWRRPIGQCVLASIGGHLQHWRDAGFPWSPPF